MDPDRLRKLSHDDASPRAKAACGAGPQHDAGPSRGALSRLTVALAGNPNSGKSTLFNAVTGSRQHVGNYPGVTVTKRTGQAVHKGVEFSIVDLPGTYSLTAYSLEERVAPVKRFSPQLNKIKDPSRIEKKPRGKQ